MLQEAIDLQQNAVKKLVQLVQGNPKKEITFRAPTGSGKTRMMSDFMNQILGSQQDVIFIVSTLSKGNLAEQNYNVFKDCAEKQIFPNLNPYLISSESANEERLFIPSNYNVYVLPRDLYKDKSKLKNQGVLLNFLQIVTTNLFGGGMNKKIYLIKDECHQATRNLDELNTCFEKVINFSATPNPNRGQKPDVEITDEEAEQAKLIKYVELDDSYYPNTKDLVKKAIDKFEQVKTQYRNLIGVNPCLIIQISNKDKAETEWANIKSVLDETRHQHLKWMSIVDTTTNTGKKVKCDTNDKVGKLPIDRWKDYAKENSSTIDIIIFKMVISEGWDIPRACMLCQVRDTESEQLNEQVMGRVRRNPRLTDFEQLSEDAQHLAMTAWVWGKPKDKAKKSFSVKLYGNSQDIPSAIKLKTTHLKSLTQRTNFDIDVFLNQQNTLVTRTSIFELYRNLQKSESEIQQLCYDYAGNDIQKWLLFNEHSASIGKEYNTFVCDYTQSMELGQDVSFPISSIYLDNGNYVNIADWVWRRKDGNDKFSFDSEAEREWASILQNLSKYIAKQNTGKINPTPQQMLTDGTHESKRLINDEKYLWGKNYLMNSEIKYEYYLNGIHSSYPDFVLKDCHGRIHIFEIKSVNVSNDVKIDAQAYKNKIIALEACYLQSSLLTNHIFYLPILRGNSWQITRFMNGKKDCITKDQFKNSLCSKTTLQVTSSTHTITI